MPGNMTSPGTGDALPQDAGRYGEPIPAGGASFRCAACGEVAAVVRFAPAGDPVDMGPPLGKQQQPKDGVIVDYWLGSTCWMALSADSLARVRDVLAAERPDPAALRAVNWELAPFWCPDCQRCYCRSDWEKIPIWDGPFYDYTDGICPAGHRHMIDD